MRVIDIANHQGYPDFVAVRRSGVEGVIIKATEGATYRNPNYPRQLREARAAGLFIGHYHFARPETNPPASEWQNFVRNADVGPHDWVVLDAESKVAGTVSSWVNDWLSRAEANYRRRPIFYSYAPWIRAHLNQSIRINADLWLAAYQSNFPRAPLPWSEWKAWQFTSSGSISGINGRVDVNDWRIPPHNAAPPLPIPLPDPTTPDIKKGSTDVILVASKDDAGKVEHFLVSAEFVHPVTPGTYFKLASNGLPHAEELHPLEILALKEAVKDV